MPTNVVFILEVKKAHDYFFISCRYFPTLSAINPLIDGFCQHTKLTQLPLTPPKKGNFHMKREK